MKRIRLYLAYSFFFLALFYPGQFQAAELLMFSQSGCEYCERWREEIGIVYPKTDEAKRAPYRELDIHGPERRKLKNIKAVVFTPTFVVVEQGEEIGRIVGYISEDFFWGYLQKILEKLPKC